MASKHLQKFPLPAGFQQILADFTKQILRDHPQNIIQYAAKYFEMLENKQISYNSKKANKVAQKQDSVSQIIKAESKELSKKNQEESQKKKDDLSQAILKIEKYQFDQTSIPLGQGTYGIVYKGNEIQHPQMKVAIKIFKNPLQKMKNQERQDIQREINFLKHLNSKYAVEMLYHGKIMFKGKKQEAPNQKKVIVTELMQGSLYDLYKNQIQEVMKKDIKEGQKLVKKYVMKIITAYRGCYINNIAHKDLKPVNILYKYDKNNEKVLKIADFGISSHQVLTAIKADKGTDGYASPQQRKCKEITNKCDVFSLGLIFSFLLLGEDPINNDIIDFMNQNKPDEKQIKKNLKKFSQETINLIIQCLKEQEKERISWPQLFAHRCFDDVRTEIEKANQLTDLGYIHWQKGQYELAMKRLEESEKLNKNDEHEITRNKRIIGDVYRQQGNYEKALEYYHKCLEIEKKVKGEENIESALTLNSIGVAYQAQGNYDKALDYYHKCLEIQTKVKGQGNIDSATTLNNIGEVYRQQGNYDKALEYYHKCLVIKTKVKGEGNIDLTSALNNIGLVYQTQGSYDQALKYYHKCLDIQTKVKGQGNVDSATTLNNIGLVYKAQGNYDKALEYYHKCLEIQTKVKGKGNIDSAITLNNIGIIYQAQLNYEKALDYYTQCLEIQTRVKGQGNIDSAMALNNIGSVYQAQENYDKALEYYHKCLEIQTKVKGQGNIDLAMTLNNIGLVYQAQGNYDKAIECYQRSLNICYKYPSNVQLAQIKEFIQKKLLKIKKS